MVTAYPCSRSWTFPSSTASPIRWPSSTAVSPIFTNSAFHQQRIAAEEQVWMASYNLEAGAQMWYLQVQQDEGTPSWRRFSELLNLRFGPSIRSNPLGELMAYKRIGSVSEYQDRFEALLHHVGALTEAQRV